MTIKLLYFAHLRELFGTAGEEIALPAEVTDVTTLRTHLAARGDPWQALTDLKSARAAVNQKIIGANLSIADGDEIAFLPPITGG